jgi:hypothetical protein
LYGYNDFDIANWLRVLSKKMKNLTSLTLSEAYFTYENHILIDHCFPLLKQLKLTTHSNNYSRDDHGDHLVGTY